VVRGLPFPLEKLAPGWQWVTVKEPLNAVGERILICPFCVAVARALQAQDAKPEERLQFIPQSPFSPVTLKHTFEPTSEDYFNTCRICHKERDHEDHHQGEKN